LDREEPVQELEAHPEVNKVDKGEYIMSDKYEKDFNSLLSALNDLAKGQKAVMDLMGQMEVNTMGSQDKKNHNGERNSTNEEGIHSLTTMQRHPHLYTRTPRPTMPQFLDNDASWRIEKNDQDIPFGGYLEEYQRLRDDFQAAMSFHDFFHLKRKNKHGGPKGRCPKTQSYNAHWGK
jgi:hypothetical protein